MDEEILRRIAKLEQHLINLIVPIQQISECLRSPNDIKHLINGLKGPIPIDDSKLRMIIADFDREMNSFSKKSEQFSKEVKNLDLSNTLAEIKFIGKRLNDIEITLKKMQEEGIKKSIELDFRCDGYELVKKPLGHDKKDQIEKPDEEIDRLFNALPKREAQILIHRIGLFGQKSNTYKDLGKMFNVTAERASQIYKKAIRRLRAPGLKPLVDKIKDTSLRAAILNG